MRRGVEGRRNKKRTDSGERKEKYRRRKKKTRKKETGQKTREREH